jgi:HK97 family phage portal protein
MLQWLKSLPFRAGLSLQRAGVKITRLEDMFGGLLVRGIDVNKFQGYESYLKAGSSKVWATFKSCDLIGKVLMDQPYRVVRRGGDGSALTTTDLGKLLSNPNPFYTLAEMVYLYAFHIKLTGNAYWAKDQPNANGDRPETLWPLNPKRVKPVLDPKVGIIGYLHRVGGVDVPYEVNELLHFRNPHPDNDYYGIGDVEAGQTLFNEFVNRDSWGEQFWKNGAAPSGILINEDPTMDRTQWEEAKLKWQAQYGGSKNAGKTAWLTGKWSYEKLGLTLLEMQNIEASKFTLENIFHLHGVPLSVAGVRDAANFATARVDDLIFRRYTIKPLMKILQDTLQSDLVAGYNGNLELLFDIAGLIDLDNVVTNYVPLFDRGAISVNELRAAAGFAVKKDDPLFDQHFINAGLVPFELAGLANQAGTEEAVRSMMQRFIMEGTSTPRRGLHEANGRP